MLKDNGFQKAKIFDAEEGTMSALKKSGLEVMVGIPNDMLATLATSSKAAADWVSKNVSSYISDGVNIRSPTLFFLHLFIYLFNFFFPVDVLRSRWLSNTVTCISVNLGFNETTQQTQ